MIVMDRPEGQTLAALLAAQGDPGLPVSAALGYLEELAAALDHLHGQQPPLVHFQAALTANKRIGAAVIAARTATDYAATLLLRDHGDDRKIARSLIADARTTTSRLALASLERSSTRWSTPSAFKSHAAAC